MDHLVTSDNIQQYNVVKLIQTKLITSYLLFKFIIQNMVSNFKFVTQRDQQQTARLTTAWLIIIVRCNSFIDRRETDLLNKVPTV